MQPIKQIKIKKSMKVSELVTAMGNIGFQAQKIAKASEIMEKMFKDKDCKIFLGVAGAMVSGGMKNIIIDMLNSGKISVFVTTGANLTHDLIEALGHKHYKGTEHINDAELKDKKINRIYNVFMEDKVYLVLEKFFEKNWHQFQGYINIREFLWKIGELVCKESKEDSILKICYKKKIPIFCPALADSGIGLMIWGRLVKGVNIEGQLSKPNKLKVDVFDDLREILDIAWTAKKSGVIYIGGGVPKNFIQQAMQFSNKQDGADYGIQITTDRPEAGGSSGAPLKEGISWGKLNRNADFIDVFCDATIALPLIWASVNEKI